MQIRLAGGGAEGPEAEGVSYAMEIKQLERHVSPLDQDSGRTTMVKEGRKELKGVLFFICLVSEPSKENKQTGFGCSRRVAVRQRDSLPGWPGTSFSVERPAPPPFGLPSPLFRLQ